MVATELVLRQLNTLLAKYMSAAHAAESSHEGWEAKTLSALLTSAQATIERVAPLDSAYLINCQAILAKENSDFYKLECLIGIVEALRDDYTIGALVSIHELIRAEVFDDFLEMAQHLLDSGYKDPAAVLVGGVLEGELRKLASRAGISITESNGRPTKSDTLNAELARKTVYSKLDQKSVTSWLDLRNKAAHGNYGEYSVEQVALMLGAVRNFVSRMSAHTV